MKKSLFIIAIALLFSLQVNAQFKLGPKVGYAVSKLTTNVDTIQSDFKNSVHFGVFARIGNKIFIQPELLYMTKGATFKYTIQDGVEQSISLNTIDVPVLLGLHAIDLKFAKLHLMAGPVAGFVINKDVEEVNVLLQLLPKQDDFEDIIWSLQFGGGLDFGNFTLDVRYDMGLSDVLKKESNQEAFDSELKNHSLLVSVGFMIL